MVILWSSGDGMASILVSALNDHKIPYLDLFGQNKSKLCQASLNHQVKSSKQDSFTCCEW